MKRIGWMLPWMLAVALFGAACDTNHALCKEACLSLKACGTYDQAFLEDCNAACDEANDVNDDAAECYITQSELAQAQCCLFKGDDAQKSNLCPASGACTECCTFIGPLDQLGTYCTWDESCLQKTKACTSLYQECGYETKYPEPGK